MPARPGVARWGELACLLRDDAGLMRMLGILRALDLPDAWLVSGCICGSAWNGLTGRPRLHGLSDYDVAFHDPDTSWEAENRVILRVAAATAGAGLAVPAQARNQARVHLWFADRFGVPFGPPLRDAAEGLSRYVTTAQAVAVRIGPDGDFEIAAPFGLDDLLGFVLRPIPLLGQRDAYATRVARAGVLWPELRALPWPPA